MEGTRGRTAAWLLVDAIVTRYVPFALLTLLTAGPIQEELGGRGFALPRLQARLGPAAGTAALGAVWAAWHLPNAVFRGWDAPTTALFLLATVLTAVPYTWLANRSRGSVLLAMLLHAGLNTSTRLVSTLVPESALAGSETTSYAVLSLAYAVPAATLLVATRGRLAAPPTTASAPAPLRGTRGSAPPSSRRRTRPAGRRPPPWPPSTTGWSCGAAGRRRSSPSATAS